MTRDLRFRFTGIVFFITFAAALLLTQCGVQLCQAQVTGNGGKNGGSEVLVAAIGVAAVLFTSEGLGFILSTLWMFQWYLRAGSKFSFSDYSDMWSDLAYDIKQAVLDECTSAIDAGSSSGREHRHLSKRLQEYVLDVYLSYFWQQAPPQLVQWVSRRVTTYLIYMSACTATAVAVGMSSALIWQLKLGWTVWNWLILLFAAVLAFTFYFNGRVSHTEGFQMIELWQSAMFNTEVRSALRTLRGQSTESEGCHTSQDAVIM